MGAKVSQPAPLPEPSSVLSVLQVSKYAAFGVFGCYVVKKLLGKRSTETDGSYRVGVPRDYHFYNFSNPVYARGSGSGTRGSGSGTRGSGSGTRGSGSGTRGSGSGTRGSGRGFMYHALETSRINLAAKLRECEDQIKRIKNVISCFEGYYPELQEIGVELSKWIDYRTAIEEKINEFDEYSDDDGSSSFPYTSSPRISIPSDETMNVFMQHQMTTYSIDKTFWDNIPAKQKFVLDILISELKTNYPHELESELRKGVVLAYNKHKWRIIPNEIRRYLKHSEKLFLQEKEDVWLLCNAFNIKINSTHPLDKFVLWQTSQLRIDDIFWKNTTPEKGQLLDQLMGKLIRVHPNVPRQTLRRAAIQAFNTHKRGVRPRELNSTVKLVGKLLCKKKIDNQRNDAESEDLCSICLCEFNPRRVFLSCTHSFHYECISTWLEEEQSCPICRRNVYEVPRPPSTPGPSVAYSAQSTSELSSTCRVQSTNMFTGVFRVQSIQVSTGASRSGSNHVSTGTSRPQTTHVSTGTSSHQSTLVSTGTSRPQSTYVSTGTSRPQSNHVSTGTSRPQSNHVSTGTSRPQSNHVSTGTSRHQSTHVSTGTSRPQSNHVSTGTSRPQSTHVSTGTSRHQSTHVSTGTSRPQSNHVSTVTSRPQSTHVSTGTSRHQSTLVSTGTSRPQSNHVSTGTSRHHSTHVSTVTSRPQSTHVSTGTSRHQSTHVSTGTSRPQSTHVSTATSRHQ